MIDDIEYPSDLRKYKIEQLPKIAEELRAKTIECVSKTGGHLGAGLGVVELTIALHYVFDTPKDKIVWDIGHQTYPHKIITGRKSRMDSLRKKDGLSGFTKMSESEYDTFGAGHSSTSISAAMGMAAARDFQADSYNVVAIIGDGSISAGMAYEAINNLGHSNNKVIVILNNNDMSIARPVGAMSKYLSKIAASESYQSIRNMAKAALNKMPSPIENFIKKTEQYIKNNDKINDIFDDLGFYSIGPVDGHNVIDLVEILTQIKNNDKINSPVLLHIVTEKGRGFISPELSVEKYHAVSSFDVNTKEQKKSNAQYKTYTSVFAETLTKIADNDKSVVAITAAMPSGTGLDYFASKHPDKMFDVGIAEQHGVTFAAGLACGNIKSFVAIYSTFLQRAYDQVVHDVAIQNLPVKFAIDRAGFVGADGATHNGVYDLTYLCCLPNFVVMAPSDGQELVSAVNTAYHYNDGPIAFRFPRGESNIVKSQNIIVEEKFEIGKGRYIRRSTGNIAFVSIGTILSKVIEAADMLKNANGIDSTIFDARFAKPIDKDEILNIASNYDIVITVEENMIGGFSAQVQNIIINSGIMDSRKIILRSIFIPDEHIEQASQEEMLGQAGLDVKNIYNIAAIAIENFKKRYNVQKDELSCA